jgi:hypothetical protein
MNMRLFTQPARTLLSRRPWPSGAAEEETMRRLLVLGGTIVGMWGPLLGTPAQAENAQSVPETLRRIEEHTQIIHALISDQSKDLAVLQQKVEGVGVTVEEVGGQLTTSIKGVVTEIGAVHEAVAAVQSSVERLPAAASRVWVSPYWTDWDTGLGGFPTPAHLIHPARVVVLNASTATVSAGCTFFEASGSLSLDRGGSLTIGPGATRTCTSLQTPLPDPFVRGTGWMMVASDHPVLVYGWYNSERDPEHVQREVMHFFPVDCSHPEGFELACSLVPSDK